MTVSMKPFCDETQFLLTIKAQQPGLNIENWLDQHVDEVHQNLLVHKAILFRGFDNRDGLTSISTSLFDELIAYRYRSTPRTNLGQYVYTATEYPRKLTIAQHCENAYQLSWPMKLLFHCVTPAVKGGATPIADMIRVSEAIEPSVMEEFERRGIKYIRNYRAGIDIPWEEVFGTNSKVEVEKFCQEHKIQMQWTDTGLRTTQVCQATAYHPVTKQKIWFNQAHLFHISALEEEYQKMMLTMFSKQELPRNAYFGDGGDIDQYMLEHIRKVFVDNTVTVPCQKDDLLLIDNMLASHGRESVEGERKVLVCMAEPYSPNDLVTGKFEQQNQLVTLHV